MTIAADDSEKQNPFRPILVSILQSALLGLAVFIAFGQSLSNKFIWDDDQYIQFNPALRTVQGLGQIWIPPFLSHSAYTGQLQFYPVTLTTFWIEYHLWGVQPFGYHLDNLLLHAGTAILLWRILRRLKIPAAFFAALIFACHPVLAESVAWATERKNVLSAFFYMLSLWCYLPWIDGSVVAADKPRIYIRGYIASLIFFVVALLSKSVTASLPAAILLLIYWKRGRITKADIKPLLPFFALGLAMGILTRELEMVVVGAIGPDFDWPILDRFAIAGRVVWFYLGKLIWPVNLSFIYQRWNIDAAHHPWQLLFLFGVIIAVVGLWILRNRTGGLGGRGPLVAALFFIGTLFPAMGFSNVYPMKFSFVADHFQYLAAIGPMVLFAAAVNRMFSPQTDRTCLFPSPGTPEEGQGEGLSLRNDPESPHPSPLPEYREREVDSRYTVIARTDSRAAIILSFVCMPLIVLSIQQTQIYRDLPTLWKDTLSKNPHAWVAMNNLATWQIQQSRSLTDLAEPAALLEKSLLEKPGNSSALMNLGIIDERRGDFAGAMKWYTEELQSIPNSDAAVIQRAKYDPSFHLGWCAWNLAIKQGISAEEAAHFKQMAERYYNAAEQANPVREEAPFELGNLMMNENRFDEGIVQLQKAVEIDPGNQNYQAQLIFAKAQAHH